MQITWKNIYCICYYICMYEREILMFNESVLGRLVFGVLLPQLYINLPSCHLPHGPQQENMCHMYSFRNQGPFAVMSFSSTIFSKRWSDIFLFFSWNIGMCQDWINKCGSSSDSCWDHPINTWFSKFLNMKNKNSGWWFFLTVFQSKCVITIGESKNKKTRCTYLKF